LSLFYSTAKSGLINELALQTFIDTNCKEKIVSESQKKVYEIVQRISKDLTELVNVSKDFKGSPMTRQRVNFNQPGFIIGHNSILEFDANTGEFKPGIKFILAN
jgi:hypothetical protein